MVGNIHSVQSLGALDGPGLRTVIFMQGCPLQCAFCHSVDTTPYSAGSEITTEQLFKDVIKNKPYWKSYGAQNIKIRGGVTITGGEPTAQPAFLEDLLKRFNNEDVHIAVDSSLFVSKSVLKAVVPYIDLWMISIKSMDEKEHLKLTSKPSKPIFDNLQYLDESITESNVGSQIRIRYVIIPGITDSEDHAKKMGRMVKNIKNLETVELLPYVTMGRYKWIELFGKYQLDGTRDATKEDVERFTNYLDEFELKIIS